MNTYQQIVETLKDVSPEYNESKLLEESLEVALEIQQRKVKYKKRKDLKPLVKECAHLIIRLTKFISDLDAEYMDLFVDELNSKLAQIKKNA